MKNILILTNGLLCQIINYSICDICNILFLFRASKEYSYSENITFPCSAQKPLPPRSSEY